MKYINKLFGILAFVFVMWLIPSCTEDDQLTLSGNDAHIISATAVTSTSASFKASLIGDTIKISVPYYVDISALSVKVEVSEYAEILPDPNSIKDWTLPHDFEVTSVSNVTTNQYTIVVAPVSESVVFKGVIRIGSQTELNNFFGMEFTQIDGVVLYAGNINDPITDLSAMSTIEKITGDLYIRDINAREIRLDALQEVSTVFIHSPIATKVVMPKLRKVAERFQVGNDFTTTIPVAHTEMEKIELPSLEYVGGSLTFYLLEQLESLQSLSKLKFIGKNLTIYGGVFTSLDGLQNITNINGNVTLNGRLKTLDGFAMKNVSGAFALDADSIPDLLALTSLESVGGAFTVRNSYLIKDLKGLENINTQSFTLETMLSLETLDGIYPYESIDRLIIQGMTELTDITALSSLKSANLLALNYFPKLTDLKGLENLKTVKDLRVYLMETLTDISALEGVDVKVLKLQQLYALNDIDAFSHITTLTSLYLYGLTALTDLSGLSNLTEITKGELTIVGCSALTDLSPLAAVINVTFSQQSDRIQFRHNTLLSDYSPVADLIKKYMDEGRVYIGNNHYNPSIGDMNNGVYSGEGGDGMGSAK